MVIGDIKERLKFMEVKKKKGEKQSPHLDFITKVGALPRGLHSIPTALYSKGIHQRTK